MEEFAAYAHYYDLLYRDKDYRAEANFVLEALARAGRRPRSLLELGCGSGRHAFAMAAAGVEVWAVDRSESMLALARQRAPALPVDCPQPRFLPGDAGKLRLERSFDAATALFHVMSYQTSEDEAMAVFDGVGRHLERGGLFFFDFWHGPGVLRDPPGERVKVMEDDSMRVERTARPAHRVRDNLVEVRYSLRVHDKIEGGDECLEETHRLRYWFLPELRRLAECTGLAVAGCGAWMTGEPPGPDAWYAWMALRA
ncbi:MAG: class I SAM-dependent methyltransferase [Planctomycetota bacterium]|jgi:SAM-dependent methyltransferase|nr:class I SAM-dependent methyltransferase [Planctomycetota bacterium]